MLTRGSGGGWRQGLAAMAGYMLLALLLGFHDGAFSGSWGAEPDEAAHFLNGVMVLDYARAGFPGHPLRYAENYYRHYPKIGLGHWPPLFATVEAAWFALVPAGYGGAMVLVTLLAAAVAVVIWWLGRRWFPDWLAGLAGVVWLGLPLVRQYSVVFMAEMLLVLVVTLAVAAFARQSWTFGWWWGLALLTKGTAIALAPLVAVGVVLGGGWNWLRQGWLWASGLLVAGLAGGWYLLAPGARHEKVKPYGGIGFLPERGWGTLVVVGENLGVALAVLALVGLVAAWRVRGQDRYWLAVLAFLPGHFVLRMSIGAWEARHLLMLLPELVLLAALGFWEIWRRLGPGRGRGALAVGVAVLTLWHVGSAWPRREGVWGFVEAARALDGARQILVVGGAAVEGIVICSVALADERRPDRTVERGTKVLLRSDFLGRSQEALVKDAAGAGAVLERLGVEGVVLDERGGERPGELVRAYLEAHGEQWVERGRYGGRAAVWSRRGPNVP